MSVKAASNLRDGGAMKEGLPWLYMSFPTVDENSGSVIMELEIDDGRVSC